MNKVMLLLSLLECIGLASALLDTRLFASSPSPTIPSFVDPGIPPPSFVFALDQNSPPYDISRKTVDPYPNCDAYHAALCAVQNSIILVSEARMELCPRFAQGGAARDEAFALVNEGTFTAPGTRGFGVFVASEELEILADAIFPELIGERLDGHLVAGYVAQGYLRDYVTWAVSHGGGFVPHSSTRVSEEELDIEAGGVPPKATTYFESCPTGERLGVSFAREPLPSMVPCDRSSNSYCALHNVRRIVGQLAVDVLSASTAKEWSDIWYGLSYSQDYIIPGTEFVSQLFQLNWIGHPGPSEWRNPGPLADTNGVLLGIGAGMASVANGYNTSQFQLYETEYMPNVSWGDWSHYRMSQTAWRGGGWQDIETYSPLLGGEFMRAALAFGVVINGTGYGVASFLVHRPAGSDTGPLCQDCSTNFSWPCSITNTLRLASHAKVQALASSDWSRLSTDPWFGSRWPSALAAIENGTAEQTWKSLSVFVFSYNTSLCVASGHSPAMVGVDAATLLGSSTVHDDMMAAADQGGGWVYLDHTAGAEVIFQVTKLVKDGAFYYLVIPTRKAWAKWERDCSSAYAESCSESNTQALVGMAAADIITAEDADDLVSRMATVANRTGHFSETERGDFRAYVLTDGLECFEGMVCVPEWPSFWFDALASALEHEEATWVLLSGSGYFEESWAFVFSARWSDRTSPATVDFVLVSLVLSARRPPSCQTNSDCPEYASCAQNECVCSYFGMATWTEDNSSCGALPSATFSCKYVAGQLCTSGDCVPCPAGLYCYSGSPVTCPQGYYCEYGTHWPSACPAGMWGTAAGAATASVCQDCPAGSISRDFGSTTCLACRAGTYVDTEGSSECHYCPIGEYQGGLGQTSCIACPSPFTTMYRGALESSECVCPEDTYQPVGSMSCLPCPGGLDCSQVDRKERSSPQAGRTASTQIRAIPEALDGFMSKTDNGLGAYKCKDASWCPGGIPGTCARNRDPTTVGCAQCLPDCYTLDDGSCTACEEGVAKLLLAGALVSGLIVLALFARMVNRDQLNQPNTMTTAVITLGLTVSAVQTLGVFSSLTVRWVEPVNSIFKAMLLLSFDLKALRIECMVGQDSVFNSVVRQSVAPAAAIYIVALVLAKKFLFDTDLNVLDQVVNATGAIFQLFFVSIFVSSLAPFICYAHPEGMGYSMVGDPAVLCTERGTHGNLVAVSLIGVFLVIIPYLALIAYATARYRTSMSSSSSSCQHLRRYRFLFFRYTPNAYWYGGVTLLRGIFICLAPVVFRDIPAMQIIFLALVIMLFSTLQLHVKPWRGSMANGIDTAINLLMVLLLVCVAMTTDFSDSDTVLGILAAGVFVAVVLGVIGVMGLAAFKHMVPAPYFSRFVCHHKADAAAQARFLQLLFVQRSKQSCFLDSDHLTNLEDLFDIVRCRCGELVVLLTSQTLRRPWCAGEITVAWKAHGRVVAIYHPSFIPPSAEILQAGDMGSYLSASDFQLVEYGITDDAVALAFVWLLNDLESNVYFNPGLVGRHKFETAVRDALAISKARSGHFWGQSRSAGSDARQTRSNGSNADDRHMSRANSFNFINTTSEKSAISVASPIKSMISGKSSNLPTKFRPGYLVISSLPRNDEATAAAGILAGKLQAPVLDLVPAGIMVLSDLPALECEEVAGIMALAHAAVVVLSEGSLDSREQLQVICSAIGQNLRTVPVNTPSFKFPSGEYFSELSVKYGSQASELESRLQAFFKSISVAYTTFASMQVIGVQADIIVSRIPKFKEVRAGGTSETSASEHHFLLKEVEVGNVIGQHSTSPSTNDTQVIVEAVLTDVLIASCTSLSC